MNLYFRRSGSGPPLVILHGLFGSSDNWQTLGRSLSEQFEVFLVDLRNHGRSPHDPEMTYEAMAGDLFDLLSAQGIREVNVIGHSMGGKVAIRFAQMFSFLVDRLVVADIGIKEYQPHHEAYFRGMLAVDVDHCPTRQEAELRLRSIVADDTTAQFLLKSLYWKEPGRLAWRFDLGVLQKENGKILAALPQEECAAGSLFIRGGESNYILDQDIDEIRKVIPRSEFKTIQGAGHWVHAEAPTEFLALVNEFLL